MTFLACIEADIESLYDTAGDNDDFRFKAGLVLDNIERRIDELKAEAKRLNDTDQLLPFLRREAGLDNE